MAQVLLPVADVAVGTWNPTPLWSNLELGLIQSSDNSSDTADLKVGTGEDPQVSTGHVLRARWRKSSLGGHVINGTLELWEGSPGVGTLIATLQAVNLGPSFVDSTHTLTAVEADSITDYSNLYLRLSRTGDTGGKPADRRSLSVDSVALEAPDAVAGPSFSGGSTTSVSVSSEGAGSKNGALSAVSEVSVDVLAEGAGTKAGQGGASTPVSASSEGAGTKSAVGGSEASVVVTAEGGGQGPAAVGEGGSTAAVSVSTEGAGRKAAAGGSTASASVSAQGSGRKASTGASETSVSVGTEGSGSRTSRGGADSAVSILVEGAGTKAAAGGSETTVSADAQGGGVASVPDGGFGGSTALVEVSAEGAGSKASSRGTEAAVSVSTEGSGSTSRSGGSETSVSVLAEGAGRNPEVADPLNPCHCLTTVSNQAGLVAVEMRERRVAVVDLVLEERGRPEKFRVRMKTDEDLAEILALDGVELIEGREVRVRAESLSKKYEPDPSLKKFGGKATKSRSLGPATGWRIGKT